MVERNIDVVDVGGSNPSPRTKKTHKILFIMKILGIETSCDETAICIIEATESNQENLGTLASTSAPTSTSTSNISILGNALNSQTKIHEKYGGVFPMMAKREHVANIMPLLENALSEAELLQKNNPVKISQNDLEKIKGIFKKEIGLCENFINFI